MARQHLTSQSDNLFTPTYESGDCAGEHTRKRKRSLRGGKVFFKT